MGSHQGAGERARTSIKAGTRPLPAPRTPTQGTDLAAFRAHFEGIQAFTEALREGRCKRTNHFDARIGETMRVLRPLFAPWNMELVFLLYMRGPLRFNEAKRILGTSSRVLTDKLRHLEREGLIERLAGDDAARYALAAKGEVVARHLHPLVFFLHNERALGPLAANP